MNKAVLIAAAVALAPLAVWSQEAPDGKDRKPPYAAKSGESGAPGERADDLSRSAFRDRVVEAIERVEESCAGDISDFCGKVTAGGGRVSLCMQAHEDQLSSACRSALRRTAFSLKRSVDRAAQACWSEIQGLCGEAGGIAQCLEQKRASLSTGCRTIVGALSQRVHGRMAQVGMPVYSSDNKKLGQVVEIVRGPDDEIRSIQVDVGRILGLGTKVVTITADKMEQLPGIKILLSEAEVRSLPEAKEQ